MFYLRDDIYGQFTVEDYVGNNFIPEICLLGEITAKKNRSHEFSFEIISKYAHVYIYYMEHFEY